MKYEDFSVIKELPSGSLTRNLVADRGSGPVVIRTLHPHIARDEIIREIYLEHARELVDLRHPGLVSTFDVSEADGTVLLVQEYCDGPSSDAGPVDDPGELLTRCREAMGALAWLHGTGRLHRGIRPGNVLLTVDGSVKLSDFRASAARNLLGLSTTTTMVALPQFTPPEIYLGGGWEGRGDVYSLAILMYFWAAGSYPLSTSDAVYGLDAASVAEPLDTLRTDLPPWFVRMMGDAMGPVDGRPTSGELAAALGRGRGTEPDVLTACLHCFRSLPIDVPVCPECGRDLPDVVAGGDTSLVIRKLGENEETVEPLAKRIRILSGNPDYVINLVTGDSRMYSKAEKKANLELSCRLVDGLEQSCAEELAGILNSGKDIKVVLKPSETALRRYKRGPVFTPREIRRSRVGSSSRNLLKLPLPDGRYSDFAAGFLRELYRCLAAFPVLGEDEVAALGESLQSVFADLEIRSGLVSGPELGTLYWGASTGSDEAARAVVDRLTDQRRALENELRALEAVRESLAEIRRGDKPEDELPAVLRSLAEGH